MVQQAKLGRADNEKRNCMATKTISCQECCLYGDVPPKGDLKGAQAGARPMRRSPTGQRNDPNESKVPFLFPRMDVLTLNIWL